MYVDGIILQLDILRNCNIIRSYSQDLLGARMTVRLTQFGAIDRRWNAG